MMARPVLSSNRGFTLIEMLVALVIILVCLLGLVQTAVLCIESNLKNLLRDEAIRLAEEQMNVLKSLPVSDNPYNPPASSGLQATNNQAIHSIAGNPVVRYFGTFPGKYAIYLTINNLTTDNSRKSIQVTVGWNYKNYLPAKPTTGAEYEYAMTSIVAAQ